jgi:amino acid permease
MEPESHIPNIRRSMMASFKHVEGLGVFTAALSLISTMIGGGISQLPYYYYTTGIIFGFIINGLFAI